MENHRLERRQNRYTLCFYKICWTIFLQLFCIPVPKLKYPPPPRHADAALSVTFNVLLSSHLNLQIHLPYAVPGVTHPSPISPLLPVSAILTCLRSPCTPLPCCLHLSEKSMKTLSPAPGLKGVTGPLKEVTFNHYLWGFSLALEDGILIWNLLQKERRDLENTQDPITTTTPT